MVSKWFFTGHDFGNANSKIVIQKGKGKEGALKISVPTASFLVNKSVIDSLGISDAPAKGEASQEPRYDKLIHQFKGSAYTYAIGEFALVQGSGQDSMGAAVNDKRRYKSEAAIRSILTLSATLLKEKEYGLRVVTGIPAKIFRQDKDKSFRESIKKSLNGTYTFSIDGGKTWRTVTIEIISVVMEGAGAVADWGNVTPDTKSGVIDIGGGTFDLYAQTGASPVAEWCTGFAYAVNEVQKLVNMSFSDAHGRDLTDIELRAILNAYTSPLKKKPYPAIHVRGVKISPEELEGYVAPAVQIVGDQIISLTNSAWVANQSGASMSPFLLIGGGAYLFSGMLQEEYSHLTIGEDPEYANCNGYAKLASMIYALMLKKGLVTAEQNAEQNAEEAPSGEEVEAR